MALPIAIAVEALMVSTKALTSVMDKVSNVFMESLAFGEDTQKASLALGTTYEDVTKRFEGTVQGLRGSIQTQFVGAFAAMEAGLQGNTAGVAKLINQQILTGTQNKQTAKVFASLHALGGLSMDATNRLSASLIETGNKYEISTDVLVTALNNLQKAFPAAQLAGMGDQMAGAVTQLQAELGPAMAGPLNEVMGLVMDTSMEGYEKLTVLGIGRVREQLMAAQDTATAVNIIKKAMITAGDRFSDVVGDVKTGFFKLGVATDIFGKEAQSMRIIQQRFADHARESNEKSVDFAMTLATLKSEVLSPIIKVLTDKFYPAILDSANVLTAAVKKISEAFADWIDELDFSEQGVRDFTLGIVKVMINTLDGWERTIKAAGELFVTTLIPAIVRLAGIIDSIPDPVAVAKRNMDLGTIFGIPMPGFIGAAARVISNFAGFDTSVQGLESATRTQEQVLARLAETLAHSGESQEDQQTILKALETSITAFNKAEAWERPGEFIASLIEEQTREGLKIATDKPFTVKGMGGELLQDLYDKLEESWVVQRESSEELERIAENTDPHTHSDMMSHTVFELGATMEKILGVGEMASGLRAVVDAVKEGTDVALENGGGTTGSPPFYAATNT